MAKPITATPTIKGEDAVRILREISTGTPDTPARVEWFREADEVFRKATERRKQA